MNIIHPEFTRLATLLHKLTSFEFSEQIPESEAKEYLGFNATLGNHTLKLRKAKLTPKKSGLFVTLWKRNTEGITEPLNCSNPFDYFLFLAETSAHSGFFMFPNTVLKTHSVLSSDAKEGKRGFRLYPPWNETESKQAEKTQTWQIPFFIDFNDEAHINQEKISFILNDFTL